MTPFPSFYFDVLLGVFRGLHGVGLIYLEMVSTLPLSFAPSSLTILPSKRNRHPKVSLKSRETAKSE